MNLTLEYESFQDFANKLWPCLSEEGMWIGSENPAGVGELVDFDVTLADGFRLFHGTGQVIAVGPGPETGPGGSGMTLRFSQLDQPSRNLVRKVVSKHIGEGGKLFVLSTPGTKVEVVGDDEAAGAGSGAEAGMGPEDLVAPFAGLEGDDVWRGEAEPELSSFLRPSGRSVDLSQELEEAAEFEFETPKVELETPEVAPSLFDDPVGVDDSASENVPEDLTAAVEDSVEEQVEDRSALATDFEEFESASTDHVSEESAGLEAASAESATPEVEPWDSGRDSTEGSLFDPHMAETQRVEPVEPIEPLEQSGLEMPLTDDDAAVEPMPSTVMPPAFPQYGADTESSEAVSDGEDFYADDEAAPNQRAWWPWVVVGGLAIGAGLYALFQMDTPLSGLLGKDESSQVATQSVVEGGESGSVASDAQAPAGVEGAGGEIDTSTPSADIGTDGSGEIDASSDGATVEAAESVLPEAAPAEVTRPQAIPVESLAPETEASDPAESAAAPPQPEQAVVAEQPATDQGLAPLRLQRITWSEVEGDTVIRLALAGPVAAERFEAQRVTVGSPRLVLKIKGAQGGVPGGPVSIGSDEVQQLRFGVHTVDGVREVHAVADLVEQDVEMVGAPTVVDGAVEIRFGRAD